MVASYIDLFERRYGATIDDEGLELLGYAADGASRMQAMVDGLLTYSRVTTRGGPLEPLDLDTVLEDAIANLRLTIDASGAEITSEDLGTVPGERGQILQLFQNLLENAIKFHEGQPTIHVSSTKRGNAIEISIQDDGPGIPEEHLERVFSVFERGPTGHEVEGAGIGLAICRQIVDRHGGLIRVASTVGEGTTFTIELPTEPSEPGEEPA